MKRYFSSIAASFVVAIASAAGAQTVLIDFGSSGSFRGVSVPAPDVNGNYWNSIAPGPFFADLKSITNAATTIDIGFDTPVGTDSYNGPAGATSFPNPTAAEIGATDIDAAALGNMGIKEAAIDYAASPGGVDNRTRFQLQQLNPAATYTLTFFGSHTFSDDDATLYRVYTDNTYSTLVSSTSLNVQTPGSPFFHNRDRLATLANLSPQAGNTLYVEFVGSNGGVGYLNELRVVGVVPEPMSLSALAAAIAVASRRRRR